MKWKKEDYAREITKILIEKSRIDPYDKDDVFMFHHIGLLNTKILKKIYEKMV